MVVVLLSSTSCHADELEQPTTANDMDKNIHVGSLLGEMEEEIDFVTKSDVVCETVDDLDFKHCNVDDLDIPSLKEVCRRVGLDLELEVLPHILDQPLPKKDKDSTTTSTETTTTTEYTREDYIEAAYECLLIEEAAEDGLDLPYGQDDDDEMYFQYDHDGMEEGEQSAEEMMATLMTNVMAHHPELVQEVVDEVREVHPDVWASVEAQVDGGRSLLEHPDIMQRFLDLLEQDEEAMLQADPRAEL